MQHKKLKLNAVILLVLGLTGLQAQTQTGNSFTDYRDGNVYKTDTIGTKIWMAENLKYLPSVGFGEASIKTPYYYVYGYNGTNVNEAKATLNYSTCGVLYNWPAAMAGETFSPFRVQGVCPSGWHLPSIAECKELRRFINDTLNCTKSWWTATENSSSFDKAWSLDLYDNSYLIKNSDTKMRKCYVRCVRD